MKKTIVLLAFLVACSNPTGSADNKTVAPDPSGKYQCVGYKYTLSGTHNNCDGTPNNSGWVNCQNKVSQKNAYCSKTGHRYQCY